MPRKSIDLPDTFHFKTQYKVLYSDINAANHMGADRVLPIALEGQLRFIKSLGYKNAIVFEDAGLIMAYSEVQYVSETMYGETLSIEVGVTNFSNKSFEIIYRLYNEDKQVEAARVRATMLFFDYEKSSVIPIPEGFRAKFENN